LNPKLCAVGANSNGGPDKDGGGGGGGGGGSSTLEELLGAPAGASSVDPEQPLATSDASASTQRAPSPILALVRMAFDCHEHAAPSRRAIGAGKLPQS
ncbi:MAG TPA: hypothetical protein VNN72_28425, partial [Polyangiaceae bacterium]|nr:hypothetical protein [Polyangiaceae bacterium]